MFSKVIAVCTLLVVSISPSVHCALWEPPNSAKEQVCRTDTCQKRGTEYFQNLKAAVNPCDDFYSFVCGNWYAQNKPPKFLAHWTVHDVMLKRVMKDLREILAKPANPADPEFNQVKYVFDFCMNRPTLGRLSPKDVAKQITTVGRFGKKPLWDIHQQYLQLTGESAFFGITSQGFPKKPFTPLLILFEVVSAYGAINHEDWKPEEEKNYSQFLFLLMKSLNLPDTDPAIKTKIKAVLEFRKKLNKLSNDRKEEYSEAFDPKTARDFQQRFSQTPTGSPSRHPQMPWEKIIKALLPPAQREFQNGVIVWARDVPYFKELAKLVSLTSEEVLVNHMEIYFAETHTVLTPALEGLLVKTSIEPIDIVQPVRQDVPRYATCLKENNMYPLIGKILQNKWFRKDIVPPVTEIFSGLRMAMVSQVQDSTWLNPQVKVRTINMIVDIDFWVGYPPWYSDPSTDEKHEAATNNPLQASAYLDLDKNVVHIRSPLLQSPFYDPAIPDVYNLGGIGCAVGHEMHHIIQNCGMHMKPDGRKVQWWPTEVRNRCKDQMKCFVDQYNSLTRKEFEREYNEKIEGGNVGSFLENYPDVMGVDIAFRLFQALKNKDKKICQTLPRFEKYSCEQMFFIAFGNTFCGKQSSQDAKYQIAASYHSINSVRVNGAVMNNKEFAKAFQCPKAKPMNPDVKCNLWK